MSVKNERGSRYGLEQYRWERETNNIAFILTPVPCQNTYNITFNLRHAHNLSFLRNSKSRDHANGQIAHHYLL